MLGKNRRKKVRKNVFYIHTNIVTKNWGEINARNNFSRNTRMVKAKMLGKKSSKNVRKSFIYIPTNMVTKKWGKNCGKQFFQKHTNSVSIKWEKNRRKKVRKKVFLYLHEYRDQKLGGGEINARNNLSRNTNIASKKCCEKMVA